MKQFVPLFLVLVAGLLALTTPARAQSWQWAVRPGGTGTTSMERGLATDAQGNVYVAGLLTGGTGVFGGTTLTAGTAPVGFVGKLSPAGAWAWAVAVPLGAGSTLSFAAAVPDGAGNLYLTGALTGAATFGPVALATPGAAYTELFVAKANSAGTWQWAMRSVSTSVGSNAKGIGLAVDPATGDPVVVGYTSSPTTFGPGQSVTQAGGTDGVIARLGAATGQCQWVKPVPSTGDDALIGVAIDGGGVIYTTGYITNGVAVCCAPALPGTSMDAFVGRLTANGQIWQWAARFGSPANNDNAVAVLPLASGEFAVAGNFQGSMTLGGTTLTSAGDRDLYVARLNAAGQVVAGSARQAGGPGRDELADMTGDQNGNLLLSGRFNAPATFGPTTYPLATAGATTAFVARYLANGTWPWVATAGGPANVAGLALALDPTGTYVYHGGQAAQSVQFGALPALMAAAGSSGTVYVARMGSVLATRPAALGGQAVQLWPNPATGTCAVRVPALPGVPQVAATLLDGLGRAVRPFSLPSGTTTALNLAGVPAGLYVLRLAAGAETTALRLAVE